MRFHCTKYPGLILLCLIAAAFSGCSSVQSKPVTLEERYPLLFQEGPNSILVLPAINLTTAADASDYYAVTIAQLLSSKGYYVMPQEITTEILRAEGITDGQQLLQIPMQKFGQLFGADAVLFVQIREWDTNYYVIGGNVTVSADYELKSTRSGETLWNNSARQVVDTSGDSNNGGGLIGALIATAIQTAVQDYMPIAQRVNAYALAPLPLGLYHPAHPSRRPKEADPVEASNTDSVTTP
jgi:hypothetical protein